MAKEATYLALVEALASLLDCSAQKTRKHRFVVEDTYTEISCGIRRTLQTRWRHAYRTASFVMIYAQSFSMTLPLTSSIKSVLRSHSLILS
jgi:hypothetical protein